VDEQVSSLILSGLTCPACGTGYLRVTANRILCAYGDCPRPAAAAELLSEQQGTDHIVVLHPGSYSVKHPLIERLDDALLHCWLGRQVDEFGEQWLADSRYETGVLESGVPYRMRAEGEGEDAHVEWDVNEDGYAVPFERRAGE
jgi:hypothetical protein